MKFTCRYVGQTEPEEGGSSGRTGPRRPGFLDCRKHTEGGTSSLPHPVRPEGGEEKEREDKKREREKDGASVKTSAKGDKRRKDPTTCRPSKVERD